jgi:pSer/pThr/pTyr-binding forkhead associated (FHA) protein
MGGHPADQFPRRCGYTERDRGPSLTESAFMRAGHPLLLARLVWRDPSTELDREFVLAEGATASIGRLEGNDICISEQHVSRQHAVIQYRDGVFLISDLGSVNGVFVNGKPIREPFPLANGDEIRLFVPTLRFHAIVSDEDQLRATQVGLVIPSGGRTSPSRLLVSSGEQEGDEFPLLLPTLTIGRAVTNAVCDICLKDLSVSRTHARLQRVESTWLLADLSSANGTFVNGTPVNEKGRALRDGDVLTFGGVITLFRDR